MTARASQPAAVRRFTPSLRRSVTLSFPAFTMIEIIVVIIIIAVLATVIVPRFGGNDRRISESEAGSLERLLTVAAEKSYLSRQPVAIAFDASARQFSLLVQRTRAAPAAASSAPAAAVDAPAEWRVDPLVAAVTIAKSRITQIAIGGRILPSGSSFNTPFIPGQPRPDISIVLQPPADPSVQLQVSLPPEAAAAVLTGAARSVRAEAFPRSVDLDDSGKGTKSW